MLPICCLIVKNLYICSINNYNFLKPTYIMKQLLILATILLMGTAFAQNNKPTFEKDGNLVIGTYYHENGMISQQGSYIEGKLHGEWKSFNNKGEKISIGNYDKGVKTGKWFFYNGEKLSEVSYTNNHIASIKTWNNNSTVVVNFKKN